MSGKTSTTTSPSFQTQTTTPSPQAAAAYSAALQQAQSVANQPFQTYSNDPNAFVAPLNQVQTGAIGNITGLAGSANPAYQAAYGLTAAGATPAYQTVQNYMSPYLGMVAAPTLQYLQQQQAQDLAKQRSQAIMQGAYGGDRAGIARSVLQGQQGLAQAQTLGNLLQQGYTQGLGAAQAGAQQQLAAGQQFGNLGAAQQAAALQQAQAQLGAGTAAQQTQQAGLSALYNQFLQSVAYPFQTAQFLSNVASGLGPLMGGTTTGFGIEQKTSPAPFFSDKRLKKNIKEVGKLNDGQPVYKYDYGDGRTQIGLLAQEVEKDHPEAVGESSGYKTVDYDEATRSAERHGKFYGGGLMPSSMGGAVAPGSERQPFEYGGMPSGDIASVLAAQAAFLPGAKGGIPGGSASPMGQSYVPQSQGIRPSAPNFPQISLSSKSSSGPQQSGLQQAIGDIKGLSDTYKGLKGAYNDVKGLLPKQGGVSDVAAAQPADIRTAAQAGSSEGTPIDLQSYASDLSPIERSHGGLIPRHGYAGGGLPGEANQSYFPSEVLDEGAKGALASRIGFPQLSGMGGGSSGGGSGGGGGLLSGLKDIASLGSAASEIGGGLGSLLGFLALSTGGAVPKRGRYADGGDVDSDAFGASDGLPGGVDPDAPAPGAQLAILPDSELSKLKGLDPEFAKKLVPFLQANPEKVGISSGYRTRQEQADLYARKPNLAAPPGHSLHEHGLATDINYYGNPDAQRWALKNAPNFGLNFPMLGQGASRKYEPWHVEPMGARRPAGEPFPDKESPSGLSGAIMAYAADPRIKSDATPSRGVMPSPDTLSRSDDSVLGGLGQAASGIGDWFDRNQKWLVPLLSGIGTMASSPSRYLGSAILQGLGGGAQAYAGLQKQQSEIAKNTLGMFNAVYQPMYDSKGNLSYRNMMTGQVVAPEQAMRALGSMPGMANFVSGGAQASAAPTVPTALETARKVISAPDVVSAPQKTPPIKQEAPSAPPPAAAIESPSAPAAPEKVAQGPQQAPQQPSGPQVGMSTPDIMKQPAEVLDALQKHPSVAPYMAKVSETQKRIDLLERRLEEPMTQQMRSDLTQRLVQERQTLGQYNTLAQEQMKMMLPPIQKALEVRTGLAPDVVAGEAAKEAAKVTAQKQAEQPFAVQETEQGIQYVGSKPPTIRTYAAPSVPAEVATIDPRTADIKSVIPKPPPGGGLPSLDVPEGTRIVKSQTRGLSEQIDLDKKFQEDFLEKAPTTDVAIERMNQMANAFKMIQSGQTTSKLAGYAALADAYGNHGLARKILGGDVAAIKLIDKNKVNLVLDMLKAATPSFAQSEFNKLIDVGTPDVDAPPQANLSMIASNLGALNWSKQFMQDWQDAKKEGWESPSAFFNYWTKSNRLPDYQESARRKLGTFGGMELPPINEWTAGATYVVPNNIADPGQKAFFQKKNLNPGDVFKFTGKAIQKVEPKDLYKFGE